MKYILTFILGALCAVAVMKREELNFSSAASGFESLSRTNQKLVKSTYQDLLKAHERQDFSQMKASAEKILALLPEYSDTRAYWTIAKRKLGE